MKSVVVHYHEIGLKGKNRAFFEERLVSNIKFQLRDLPIENVKRLDGRILIDFRDLTLPTIRANRSYGLERVFGISSFSPVIVVKPNLDDIKQAALNLAREKSTKTFAVRSKRADKKFPLTSEKLSAEVGGVIFEGLGIKVDLKNPELTVQIEVTAREALISTDKIAGAGGLPVGTAGRVVAMLSGGIDSPVAAWKLMKRGAEIVFAHFHSYPHTTRDSINKVRELAKIVGAYQPKSTTYFIPFAEAQREIVMKTEPKYRVLLYRRLMLRITNSIAGKEGAEALVTGESLGQVASQTLPNLASVEAASDRPVFRPLIGDDKEEIIARAKQIGTFELSIQPHDDCCTLFVPKNPATRARVADLEREEAKLDIPKLVRDALERVEIEKW